jgi:hypothetical protein
MRGSARRDGAIRNLADRELKVISLIALGCSTSDIHKATGVDIDNINLIRVNEGTAAIVACSHEIAEEVVRPLLLLTSVVLKDCLLSKNESIQLSACKLVMQATGHIHEEDEGEDAVGFRELDTKGCEAGSD